MPREAATSFWVYSFTIKTVAFFQYQLFAVGENGFQFFIEKRNIIFQGKPHTGIFFIRFDDIIQADLIPFPVCTDRFI